MDAEAYRQQLAALLPQGLAWPRDPDSVLQQLLLAFADELARVDARAADLLDEADPRTTLEMLDDWEDAHGLPGECLPDAETISARRAALVAHVAALGGQSPAYYIAVAEALGHAITITEFQPFTVGSTVDEPIYGEDWGHAWQINASETDVTSHLVDGGVDEALAWWGVADLECVIGRLKPAHTLVLFAYGA